MEKLIELYVNQKLSFAAVGKIVGMTATLVRTRLITYGIKPRSRNYAAKISKKNKAFNSKINPERKNVN